MVQFCYLDYRKILKIKFGLIFFKGPFWGAYLRRDIRFDIDWASLIVGRKFTVLALFYFVFEGNFPSTSPRGAYIWRSDLVEGFLRYRFGGAYIWRGLYMERHWSCFLSSVVTDAEDGHGLKLEKIGPTFSKFKAMPAKITQNIEVIVLWWNSFDIFFIPLEEGCVYNDDN